MIQALLDTFNEITANFIRFLSLRCFSLLNSLLILSYPP